MEEVSRSRRSIRIIKKIKRKRKRNRKQLEYVPDELIQHIQSLLPVEEAARTCVLSKSWLHAWSTIPTLRFRPPGRSSSVELLSKEQKRKYNKFINRTLLRYHRDNIPITSFDLQLGIENHKSASLAVKWIRPVASKSCLKELCLTIFASNYSFTLPDEIFSSENLNTISVRVEEDCYPFHPPLCISINSSNPINCVNLRVLKLINVHIISEEVLDKLFSACSLLEKIKLSLPKGLRTIRVRNLRYLCKLKIVSKKGPRRGNNILEIDNVPSLRSFSYQTSFLYSRKPISLNTDFLSSVRELFLGGVLMDQALSQAINSSFPFLETLTLKMDQCKLKILDIRCVSLKRLMIELWENKQIEELQVYGPELVFFSYDGSMIPNLLLFPTIAPEQIELRLMLTNPFDGSFFLRIRKALNLLSSSKFRIELINNACDSVVPSKIDVDDLRTRVPVPALNVEEIFFKFSDESLWEHSTFFDAFLCICHPNYIEAFQSRLKGWCSWEQIIEWMMEKKTSWPHLKDVHIKNPYNRKWETLETCQTTALAGAKFKLTWW